MKLSGSNIKLASVDDLFETDESRARNTQEQIKRIPIAELHPFKDHPFRVTDDERMRETVESVKEYGVLVPAIARPLETGGYELVSGHRRKRACELAGLDTMPVIVRDLDNDEAVIIMVDSNLQRENIPPSERAKAYQMKLEAIKHQGARSDLTSDQVGQKLSWAVERVAEDAGKSKTQVQRFIRLNNLEPELKTMVDEGRLAFNPAVEVSFMKSDEQQALISALETTQAAPSLSQAQRMKKLSQEGKVSEASLTQILSEEKKPLTASVTLSQDTLRKYFPKNYTTKDMERVILKLLESWQRKRQQSQVR